MNANYQQADPNIATRGHLTRFSAQSSGSASFPAGGLRRVR